MEASIVDLRRRMKEVLGALERNESVTILYHGKKKAVLRAASAERVADQSAAHHKAFGMWKDREDMDVDTMVRRIRQGRVNAL